MACLFVHTQQKSPKIASSVCFDSAHHHIIQNMITHNCVVAASCTPESLAKTIILLNRNKSIVYSPVYRLWTMWLIIEYFKDIMRKYLLPHSCRWQHLFELRGVVHQQWCTDAVLFSVRFNTDGKCQVLLGDNSILPYINLQWSSKMMTWLFSVIVLLSKLIVRTSCKWKQKLRWSVVYCIEQQFYDVVCNLPCRDIYIHYQKVLILWYWF